MCFYLKHCRFFQLRSGPVLIWTGRQGMIDITSTVRGIHEKGCQSALGSFVFVPEYQSYWHMSGEGAYGVELCMKDRLALTRQKVGRAEDS